MMSSPKCKTIIIGGGISGRFQFLYHRILTAICMPYMSECIIDNKLLITGLSAARWLDKHSQDVTVLEARDRVGGRTHTVRVNDNFSFVKLSIGALVCVPTLNIYFQGLLATIFQSNNLQICIVCLYIVFYLPVNFRYMVLEQGIHILM